MAIERTYHTPGAVSLDLRIPAGHVEIETYDGKETIVELDADDPEALDRASIGMRERGGGYEVTVEVERKKGGVWGAFELNISFGGFARGNTYRLHVRCPHGAAVRVATAAADVEARGRFASLEGKTASGDLVVGEVELDATVKTASGDVRVDSIGGEARLQTVSGDVEVSRVEGDLSVQTVSGDVRVQDAARSVKARTVSGDQRLAAVQEGEVELQSVSGDIEVGIRRGSAVHVDATSLSGSMSSELELADEPGDGGDGPAVELRAKTVSGDVRVLRAAAREHV
jgi:hypothetical protein